MRVVGAGRGPVERLAAAISRRGVLRGAAAVGAGALLGRVGRADADALRTAAQEAPSTGATIDAVITLEALGVTFFGVARQRGAAGDLGFGNELLGFLRAAQCEAEAHYHYLEYAGAASSVLRFTVPEAALADRAAFLVAVVDLKGLSVAAYMAAARALATVGDLRLVEIAYQIGAVEAQHLALARYLLGARPANDRAFASWRFADVAEIAPALTAAGFIGGPGPRYKYPGPVDRFCRGVFGLVPETTDDVLAAAARSLTVSPAPSTPPATPAA